jgi:hypothetical protein
LLLIFDNGAAHVRSAGTNVYVWSQIQQVQHQAVHLEYGGMSTGSEHAYLLIDKDGRRLILLGRSYAAPAAEASGDALTDVEQVANFLQSKRA